MSSEEAQQLYLAMLRKEMNEKAVLTKALVDAFGDGVIDVVRRTIEAQARDRLQQADLERRDLSTVMEVLWDQIGDIIEFEVEEQSDEHLRIRVTKCLFADEMRRLGVADAGFAFYCAYDDGFCEGLNPAIRFTRTKTLMEGDDICNHTYELRRDR
jgi:hypothetical protein